MRPYMPAVFRITFGQGRSGSFSVAKQSELYAEMQHDVIGKKTPLRSSELGDGIATADSSYLGVSSKYVRRGKTDSQVRLVFD